MANPEILQSKKLQEFERRNQFRVEVPDPQRLYVALGQSKKSSFIIGASHSEEELFSQISAEAMVDVPTNSYSVYTDLIYENPAYQYWPQEQVQKVEASLADIYGPDAVSHHVRQDFHSIIVKDFDAKLLYKLELGPENARTAWLIQVKQINEMLNDAGSPYFSLLESQMRQRLSHLVNNPHPNPINSYIGVKPIDEDPNIDSLNDFFPSPKSELAYNSKEFEDFVNRIEKWARLVENAVRAMARARGIPQSGKLAILI